MPESILSKRYPRSGELIAVRNFTDHLSQCQNCNLRDFEDPWKRPHSLSLCCVGSTHAQAVVNVLRCRHGRLVSAKERRQSGKRIEVIPREAWTTVRALLVAVEHGLKFVLRENESIPAQPRKAAVHWARRRHVHTSAITSARRHRTDENRRHVLYVLG